MTRYLLELVTLGTRLEPQRGNSRLVGNPSVIGLRKVCPSSAQNPKPAGPGRERYRYLRQERTIKARDRAMLAT